MGFIEMVLAVVVGQVVFVLSRAALVRLNRPPLLTAAELDERIRRDLGH